MAERMRVGDDHTGTVSFRAECPHDVEMLVSALDNANPGSYLIAGSWEDGEFPDVEVEMQIRPPLTIAGLHAFMRAVPDSHVMMETLRSGPAELNSMERRYESEKPADWSKGARQTQAAAAAPRAM